MDTINHHKTVHEFYQSGDAELRPSDMIFFRPSFRSPEFWQAVNITSGLFVDEEPDCVRHQLLGAAETGAETAWMVIFDLRISSTVA